MQGYIIDIKPVRDDDLIVTILTENELITAYRFYGARHSNINIGFKIDFELEKTKSSIQRLKDVIQLGFPWILDSSKMYAWQRYLKLFNPHLKDLEKVDSFYFYSLEKLISMISKQNVLRSICESYISLIEYEGRLQKNFECLLCEIKIEKKVSLIRSLMPVHATCIRRAKSFDMFKIKELFENKKTIYLDDSEIDILWDILLQGL